MVPVEGKKILSIEDILAAPDVETRTVDVPEWGGAVKIGTMTKADQQRIRAECMSNGSVDLAKLELMYFVICVVEPRFTEAHLPQLKAKASAAFDRVLKEILELNGLTEEAGKEIRRTFPAGVS